LENFETSLDENGFKPFCWSKNEINQSNRIKNRLEKKTKTTNIKEKR